MATHLIRELDDTLWKKVRAKAALEGITLKELMVQLLAAYVKAAPRKS